MDLVENNSEISNKEEVNVREWIMDVQESIVNTEGSYLGDSDVNPLKHLFAPGIYVREIFIPKGQIIVGKIHKHVHPNVLLSGTVDVITEGGGKERLIGPCSMLSPAGTKRVLHSITDLVWITYHSNPTDTEDLKEIERDIIAEDYKSYDIFALKEHRKIKFIQKMKKRLIKILSK